MTPESPRAKIQVDCPDCGNRQMEPALVISTRCRSCGVNFTVRDGSSVARGKFGTRLSAERLREDSARNQPPRSKWTFLKRLPLYSRWSRSLAARFHKPHRKFREVECFECHHAYHAAAQAMSTQCPRCGSYISLKDYEIDSSWNRRIQTRGDVVIGKQGSVSGTTIQCHHLTVLGALAGSVDCSGDLVIRSHGKILGKVRCRQLRVERGAKVEFLNPVEAKSAFLDGQVQGQISCSGAITLERNTSLQGAVRTASLIVKPGAKHTGSIEMVRPA